MQSIGLVSQKGGAGKTTLAIHLAVLAHNAGLRTVLVDCDPQRSAGKWWRRREAEEPVLVETAARDLPAVLEAAAADGYDLAVVDTAPHADAEATRAVRAVDLALIPCRPSSLDMDAVEATVALVQAVGKPAAIVLNACPAGRGIAEAGLTSEAKRGLAQHGLPIVPVGVVQRVALSHALIDGRAVTEFEPEGKAAEEMTSLWRWCRAQEGREMAA